MNSHTQTMEALEYANEVRLAQSGIYRQLRSLEPALARRFIATMLRRPQEGSPASRMRLERLLRGARRIRVEMTIRDAGITPRRLTARVEDLTERERFDLAEVLERWEPKK